MLDNRLFKVNIYIVELFAFFIMLDFLQIRYYILQLILHI